MNFKAILIACLAILPSVVLAHAALIQLAITACALVSGCLVARWVAGKLWPNARRNYLVTRLCSPRYLVPALGLPLLSAQWLSYGGFVGIAGVTALHGVIALRYKARFNRPGVFPQVLVVAAVGGLFCAIEWLALSGREWRFGGKLFYAEESPRQRVVLVQRGGSLDLLIDGELQFRTEDEHLYHRGLLAPVISHPEATSVELGLQVLIMGGGDGLAARDLLRSNRVGHITVVDWDRAVTRLFSSDPMLIALNIGALRDPRVTIVHRDIRDVLASQRATFDAVIGDLTDPDPSASVPSPLYSAGFYGAIRKVLRPGGLFVTHACSLDGSCISQQIRTAMEDAGFITTEHVEVVPSFGDITYVTGKLG